MKKFYSLVLGALLAFSANAASQLTISKATDLKLTEVQPANQNVSLHRAGKALDVKINPVASTASEKATKSQQPKIDMFAYDGEATWTDDVLSSYFQGFEVSSWTVEVDKHLALDIYRISDPYAHHPLVEEGKIQFTADADRYLYLNATDPDAVFVCDENGNVINYYDTGMVINQLPFYFTIGANLQLFNNVTPVTYDYAKFKNRIFTFPGQTSAVGILPSADFGASPVNDSGKMSIKLEGAQDYSLDLAALPMCSDGQTACFDVTFGSDVAFAKYLVMSVPYVNAGWDQSIGVNGREMPLENGTYNLDVSDITEHTEMFLAICVYDADGNQQDFKHVSWSINGSEENWIDLGTGEYTDGFFSGMFSNFPSHSYDVAIQKHRTIQNYFRIVNPYTTEAWPEYDADGETCGDHNHYLYIRGTEADPTKLYVEFSPLGIDYAGMGQQCMTSNGFLANNGYQMRNEPLYGSIDDNDLLSFPQGNPATGVASSLSVVMSGYNDGSPTSFYNMSLSLQLPEDWAAIDGVVMDENDNAPVEFYNLQGMRVSNVENAPGLYIRKQGDKTQKLFVK